MSPQRLGGPGGRIAWLQKRLPQPPRFSEMAGAGVAHRKQPHGTGRSDAGGPQSIRGPLPARVGHALDAAGHFRRRVGPEPVTLCLSYDSHHGFVFRGAGRPGQTQPDQTGFPWHLLFDWACPDQLHVGGRGRALHRPLRPGSAHLGGRHGQPMVRFPDFLYSQPGDRITLVCASAFFQPIAAAAQSRGLDDMGAQADGLGPGGRGRLFY